MKIVVPTQKNYDISESDSELTVSIHKHQIDTLLRSVGIVGLSIWALAGALLAFILGSAIREFMSWTSAIFPFIMWASFGFFIIAVIAFRLTFHETIKINKEAIVVEYDSWLFKKRSYKYLANQIQGLRSSPLPPTTLWSGRIAFDYGGKTLYFGSKLTESEAQHILAATKTKFTNYDLAKW